MVCIQPIVVVIVCAVASRNVDELCAVKQQPLAVNQQLVDQPANKQTDRQTDGRTDGVIMTANERALQGSNELEVKKTNDPGTR